MLFRIFKQVAKKYWDKSALNSETYGELLQRVEERPYSLVSAGEDILADILVAAKENQPLKIPPLHGNYSDCNDLDMNRFSLVLWSSGTTSGVRKPFVLSESMLINNAITAQECQNITEDDRVLTVCSLRHTGGINAQTIPTLLTGGSVILKQFNQKNFFKVIDEYDITLTHLVPRMMDVLLPIEPKQTNLKMVVCGSDCIKKEYANYWVKQKIPFQINYGQTQAGPMIINHTFTNGEELTVFDQGIPLGSKAWCDTRIVDGELELKGRNTISSEWFGTDDCVEYKNSWYFYKGRKSAGCRIIPKSY